MNPAPASNPPAFRAIPDLVREHAGTAPQRRALALAAGTEVRAIDYATLDARMDRVAAALQRDGLQAGDAIALCAATSIDSVTIAPEWPFNIIYSSGTTGEPKGIVQSHGMRWAHVRRGSCEIWLRADTVTLLSTPLYSNTTLVVFFPTLAFGGTVVLMPKFDAAGYLRWPKRTAPPTRCWCRCSTSA
jgi:long-chain acyl-CoA synthetase